MRPAGARRRGQADEALSGQDQQVGGGIGLDRLHVPMASPVDPDHLGANQLVDHRGRLRPPRWARPAHGPLAGPRPLLLSTIPANVTTTGSGGGAAEDLERPAVGPVQHHPRGKGDRPVGDGVDRHLTPDPVGLTMRPTSSTAVKASRRCPWSTASVDDVDRGLRRPPGRRARTTVRMAWATRRGGR